MKQQDLTSEKVKAALYSLLTNCINNFKKVSAARELEPPSVANVKNSVPVLQKHILRENKRLEGIRKPTSFA